MDISFEKIGSKVKDFAKKPGLWIGAGLGLLALFWLYRSSNSSNSSETTTGESLTPTQNTGSDTSYQDLYNALSASNQTLSESISEMYKDYTGQIQNLSETLAGYQQQQTETLSDVIDTLNDKIDKSISTVKQVQETTDTSEEDNSFNQQVEAAKSIKKLSDLWFSTQQTFMRDNNISADEQKKLDDIHLAAESIGIAAGFGQGGLSGSERVIPADVKKAAGLS